MRPENLTFFSWPYLKEGPMTPLSSTSPISGMRSNIQRTSSAATSSSRIKTPSRPMSSSLIKSSSHHGNYTLCLPREYEVVVYRAQGGGTTSEFIQVTISRFNPWLAWELMWWFHHLKILRIVDPQYGVGLSPLFLDSVDKEETVRLFFRQLNFETKEKLLMMAPVVILRNSSCFSWFICSTFSSKWSTGRPSSTTCGCCNPP